MYNYRKEVTAGVCCVCPSREAADAWARRECMDEYGEVFDVTGELCLGMGVTAYSRRDPWDAFVYFAQAAEERTALPAEVPVASRE